MRVEIGDGRAICASPLPMEVVKELAGYDVGDHSGYFLYEEDLNEPRAGIELLAKAASYEAAVSLMEMIESTRRAIDVSP